MTKKDDATLAALAELVRQLASAKDSYDVRQAAEAALILLPSADA